MNVAGLKSITAKHLALSAQAAGAVRALHPVLWAVLTEHVPQSRRALLVPDFDRLLQARHRLALIHIKTLCCPLCIALHSSLTLELCGLGGI